MKKAHLLLFTLALFAAGGCRTDEVRPANYDILAMATGHWEWESTRYFGTGFTPATEGYTRQLVFGANHLLVLRRANQADQRLTYQLAVGSGGTPTITYSTNEEKLANNDTKFYFLKQENGQQILQLTGEKAAYDAGGYERYHWVAE